MDPYIHDNSSRAIKQEPGTNKDENDLFIRHTDSVLCCSIDNGTRIAVSGGIDDTAFVWDLNTKHVIFECSGHKESVVAAAFSLNSTYVATGDLNGYIQVRNTTTGIKVFDFEIDEVNWILWHNTSDYVLLAGTTKGDFWMWNVNDPAAVKTFNSFGSSSLVARLLPDGLRALIAYQDGSIRMFDLKTQQSVFYYQDGQKAEIISMDLNTKKLLLAVGSIDSTVKLLTVGNLKVIGSLSCKTPESYKTVQSSAAHSSQDHNNQDEPMDDDSSNDEDDHALMGIKSEPVEVIDEYTNVNHENDGQEDEDDDDEDSVFEDGIRSDLESVESVLFSPCGNFLAAANNSGTIIIWDISTLVVRYELHTGVGVTRAAWTSDGRYIAGHLDGSVRVYDNNLVERSKIIAHKDQILDLALMNGVLVTASEDKTVRVIKL